MTGALAELDDAFADSSVGQLRRNERRALYCVIRAIAARAVEPVVVFDLGTWLGGGTTYFSALAVRDAGRGRVISVESDGDRMALAVSRYAAERPTLAGVIDFVWCDSARFLATTPHRPDVVVVDGGDRRTDCEALNEIADEGCVVLFHDWSDDRERAAREALASAGWIVAGVVEDLAVLVRMSRCG